MKLNFYIFMIINKFRVDFGLYYLGVEVRQDY
jgi:hypothetical protein